MARPGKRSAVSAIRSRSRASGGVLWPTRYSCRPGARCSDPEAMKSTVVPGRAPAVAVPGAAGRVMGGPARPDGCGPGPRHGGIRAGPGRRSPPAGRTGRDHVTTDILEQRAGIEREIDGRTVCDLLRAAAENSGDAPALSNKAPGDGAGWQTLTWAQARQQALELAAGYAALGLARGERVALMLPNCAAH